MVSGGKPGDPAPTCTGRAAFPFGGSAEVLLCSGSLKYGSVA
jgi:hypothetical protein